MLSDSELSRAGVAPDTRLEQTRQAEVKTRTWSARSSGAYRWAAPVGLADSYSMEASPWLLRDRLVRRVQLWQGGKGVPGGSLPSSS